MRKIIQISLVSTLLLAACSSKREQTKPLVKSITEAVYASGRVKAAEEYKVYASVPGIIKTFKVTEGDTVSFGTAIAEIVNTSSKIREENTHIFYEAAKRNAGSNSPILNELLQTIETASLKMKDDSVNKERFQKLFKESAISKADFEKAELAYKASKNNYLSLVNRYSNTKEQLQTELKNAQKQLELSNYNQNEFTIKSFIDGTVYALFKQPGEMVLQQEPIALIGNSKNFLVELVVDELDINKVVVNQKVLISLDTYGEQIFEAKIVKIYPLLDAKTQTFKVDVAFTNPPQRLYPGLTAEANIIISEKQNSLVIPKSYLVNPDTLITEKGKIKISKGIENLEFVEILSGVDSTTVLLKP